MPAVRIQILSDLHLENPEAYKLFEIIPVASHLALLGDIGHTKDDGLFDFLRRQLRNFETISFVSGNHEPYHSSAVASNTRLLEFQDRVENERKEATKFGNPTLGRFVILNQTRFDISPAVTILGCTLFSRITPEQKDHVSFGMNDFYHIKDWTIEDHDKKHKSDLAWLNHEVTRLTTDEPDRKIVILTHYSPTVDPRSIDPAHTNSKISSGFMTDLSTEKCWTTAGNIKAWAFGHTHYNCDFIDENTGRRVVTNQRGYYFAQARDLQPHKVIEI
jgi:hypothetical protein